MATQKYRPRIFLSCGQSDKKEVPGFGKFQKTVSEEIEKFINTEFKEDFEVYWAPRQRKNETVLNAVFHELSESEYILFIDFADNTSKKRGSSLFANQEFAVASFLDIPFITLAQQGVERDGILNHIQSDIKYFSNEKQLYELIREEIKLLQSDWKNKLSLERIDNEKSEHFINYDFLFIKDGKKYAALSTFYHVNVKNLHYRKIANNCYGYITQIIDLDTGKPYSKKPLKTTELKWAGFTRPNATIVYKKPRDIDVFFVVEEEIPPIIRFNTLTDSDEYRYIINDEGNYSIEILIVSDNFRPEKKTFYLHLGKSIDKIIFTDDNDKLPKIDKKKKK